MIKTNFNIRVSDPLLEPYLPVIRQSSRVLRVERAGIYRRTEAAGRCF